jgi:hypothetical protein
VTNTHQDKPDRDDEGRGDNPGVGGVPANGEIEHGEPDDEIVEDEAEIRRDNPGVGGVPADRHDPKP